jgi:hypothetical protein
MTFFPVSESAKCKPRSSEDLGQMVRNRRRSRNLCVCAAMPECFALHGPVELERRFHSYSLTERTR